MYNRKIVVIWEFILHFPNRSENIEPEKIWPVMARSESGKRTADFAFPETKIGRKGMPKSGSDEGEVDFRNHTYIGRLTQTGTKYC